MTISYSEPHKRPDDLDPKVNGPFRDDEQTALEDASRKGEALDFFKAGMKAEAARRKRETDGDTAAGSAEEVTKAKKAAHDFATKDSATVKPAKKTAAKKTAVKKAPAKKAARKK
jgi:hypothetical protein